MTFTTSGVIRALTQHPDDKKLALVHVNLTEKHGAGVKGGDIVLHVALADASSFSLGEEMSFTGWSVNGSGQTSLDFTDQTSVPVPPPPPPATPAPSGTV